MDQKILRSDQGRLEAFKKVDDDLKRLQELLASNHDTLVLHTKHLELTDRVIKSLLGVTTSLNARIAALDEVGGAKHVNWFDAVDPSERLPL